MRRSGAQTHGFTVTFDDQRGYVRLQHTTQTTASGYTLSYADLSSDLIRATVDKHFA